MTTADLPPDKVLIACIKEAVALNENGVKVSRSPRRKVALAAKCHPGESTRDGDRLDRSGKNRGTGSTCERSEPLGAA